MPCAVSVRSGICQPCQDRASIPLSCRQIASSPDVTCSPVATTASYSRASCSGDRSVHHLTSWLVTPDMADTTTATWLPASTSRFTRWATLRIRSRSATEVPPNFITMRAMKRINRHIAVRAHTYWRTQGGATSMSSGTVSASEVGKFDRLASRWWDPNGPMKPLHRMNPARVGWIESLIHGPSRILDVGCGAGLAAEALAKPWSRGAGDRRGRRGDRSRPGARRGQGSRVCPIERLSGRGSRGRGRTLSR